MYLMQVTYFNFWVVLWVGLVKFKQRWRRLLRKRHYKLNNSCFSSNFARIILIRLKYQMQEYSPQELINSSRAKEEVKIGCPVFTSSHKGLAILQNYDGDGIVKKQ